MKQLSPTDKYNQMSYKYKNLSVDTIITLSKSMTDLQGWRNKLVDISLTFYPNILLDIGGGNGQQIFRFKSTYKNSFIPWIVDFAEKPKKIIEFFKLNKFNYRKQDVFEFLEDKNIPKFDMVYMFGFLHEIKNIKTLLVKLKKKTSADCNIIISDNNLYNSADDISKILSNFNKNFTVYSSKSFLNRIHVFTKISGLGKKRMYCFHKGRVDNILAICGSLNKKNQFTSLI